jgi:hypothetical protein
MLSSLASSFSRVHVNKVNVGTPLWMYDAGPKVGYQVYSADMQRRLEDALTRGYNTPDGIICSYSMDGISYEVDLCKMLQRNVATGAVCCVVRLRFEQTHAVLDRDSARLFWHLSRDELSDWIKANSAKYFSKSAFNNKEALLLIATEVFHSSREFPVLLRNDFTPFPIFNPKRDKHIKGSAKPTILGESIAPIMSNSPSSILCRSRDVQELVALIDGPELANRVILLEDLTAASEWIWNQYNALMAIHPLPPCAFVLLQSEVGWTVTEY